MNGLFITGTDTGVGKTRVTAALAVLLRRAGHAVGVMKPVATGGRPGGGGLLAEDTMALLEAAGHPRGLGPDEVTPFVYEPPVSPSVAARRAGRPVDMDRIVASLHALARRFDVLLVEGVGGAMVPLGATTSSGRWGDRLVSDLAAAIGLPVLIVSRDALGTISHTLLTLDHLERRGVRVAGVLLNRLSPETDAACANAEEIARVGRVRVWGPLPHRNDSTVLLPATWESVLREVCAETGVLE